MCKKLNTEAQGKLVACKQQFNITIHILGTYRPDNHPDVGYLFECIHCPGFWRTETSAAISIDNCTGQISLINHVNTCYIQFTKYINCCFLAYKQRVSIGMEILKCELPQIIMSQFLSCADPYNMNKLIPSSLLPFI